MVILWSKDMESYEANRYQSLEFGLFGLFLTTLLYNCYLTSKKERVNDRKKGRKGKGR